MPVAKVEKFLRVRGKPKRENLRRDNAKLQRQRENADRENRIKSRFLASMSHELRTPLNAIIGFSELLDQETFGPLVPRQKEFVTNVVQSGRHLLNLVNEILDLSKIEAGHAQLSREWISVPAMVEAVSAVGQSLALQQKIDLKVWVQPYLPQIYADPMRIKQVLYNLLSNAIKFTLAGGTVTLRASRSADGVNISVEDSGIGIKPENLPRLFREFEKLEAADGLAREGTGLGLILTKRLVELHGGSIQVASELGKGTELTVRLPLTGTKGPNLTEPELHEASGLPMPASLVAHLRGAVNLADRQFKQVALLLAKLPQFSRSTPALWAQPLQAHIRTGDFLGLADENTIGLVAYGAPESIEKALSQRFSDLLSRTLSEPAGPVRVVWYPFDSRDPEQLLKKALSAG